MPGVRRGVIIATLICCAIVACGGDDDGGAADDSGLAARLPGDARAISVVDLTEVKEKLGLPEDADPTKPLGDGGGEAQARLFGYSAGSFPYLVRLEQSLIEAFDESRVSATASTTISGPDAVTAPYRCPGT